MNSSIFTQSEVDGLIKKITDLTRDQFSIPKVGFTSSRLRLAVAYYHPHARRWTFASTAGVVGVVAQLLLTISHQVLELSLKMIVHANHNRFSFHLH